MSCQCLGPWGWKSIDSVQVWVFQSKYWDKVTWVPSMSRSVGWNWLTVYWFGPLKASIETLANTCPVNVSVCWGESLLTVYRFGSIKESIQTLAYTCPVNVSVSWVATKCSTTSLPTCKAKHFKCTVTHVPSMSRSMGWKPIDHVKIWAFESKYSDTS